MIYVFILFKAKETRYHQVEALLDALHLADEDSFDKFCSHLRQTEQGHIVDKYLQVQPTAGTSAGK